VKLKGNPQWI